MSYQVNPVNIKIRFYKFVSEMTQMKNIETSDVSWSYIIAFIIDDKGDRSFIRS